MYDVRGVPARGRADAPAVISLAGGWRSLSRLVANGLAVEVAVAKLNTPILDLDEGVRLPPLDLDDVRLVAVSAAG